jgi:plasmid stabilization system protein ParE
LKVVLTFQAQADLQQIADYIAADNPVRALTFVQELRGRCESLADMPQAFPLVPRYEQHGIRRRVYGNVLIFYQIGAGQIEVLHILRARDIDALLFPTD